jgi:hypothetical protein
LANTPIGAEAGVCDGTDAVILTPPFLRVMDSELVRTPPTKPALPDWETVGKLPDDAVMRAERFVIRTMELRPVTFAVPIKTKPSLVAGVV